MGAYKQKMLEGMEDEDHTDEYGAFMDNDEDDDSFDEDGEERAKNDDAAFCAKENYDSDMRRQYDNDELVEVIEDLQKKAEKDNG